MGSFKLTMFDYIKKLMRTAMPRFASWFSGRRLGMSSGFSRAEKKRVFNRICSQIDVNRLDSRLKSAKEILNSSPEAACKYYDRDIWLKKAISRAGMFRLNKSPCLRILDLGCGPGWYIAVARHFNHDILGIDLPYSMMRQSDIEVYKEIPRILKCDGFIVRSTVEAFVPLDIEGPFDLVTAFAVCFDGQWSERPWGSKEWEFFLGDVKRLLTAKGRLYLELNDKPKAHSELIYYDEETFKLFSERGVVRKSQVMITN